MSETSNNLVSGPAAGRDQDGVVARVIGAYKRSNRTAKFVVGLLFLFAGLGVRYWVASLHWSGAMAELANDFGAVLVGSITITFVYDNFIRTDEKAIFLEDLRALLHEMRSEERESLRADLRILMKSEHKGRVLMVYPSRPDIREKIQVIKTAKHSVIEVGTALHTYVNYLSTAAESEYQAHVVDLLRKHVVFQCAMMKPELAKLTHPEHPDMETKIRSAQADLLRIKGQLAVHGKFEVLEYNHAPCFAAICVDGDQPSGQMFVTPYLYGVRNANAPSFLFTKAENPDIFEKYWASIQNLMRNATAVPPAATHPSR